MLRHILESIDTIAPDVVVVVLGACRLRARGEAVVGGVHLRSHGHRSEIAWGAGKSGP
ncbi:hypothetical protein [Arsenicicoccus cauae]|nr:hypothetical protein [Arsenicicoccus cauae]